MGRFPRGLALDRCRRYRRAPDGVEVIRRVLVGVSVGILLAVFYACMRWLGVSL